MCKGKVKYFNDRKGWGFLSCADCDQEVYVHYTAINVDGYRTLTEGQEVTYEIAMAEYGPRAINVVPEREATAHRSS
jgi:CspA family cold shock protein